MNGLPTIIGRRIGPQHSEIELIVAADCPWFAGHFPGCPILPGVVQIGWAAHFASEIYRSDAGALVLERIKFKRVILPGAHLTLQLMPVAGTQKLRYDYRAGETSYSSGTFGALA